MNDAHILIPARYASTRFPGKPLADLNGSTVIARVVRAALQTRAARPITVATDDERIAREVDEPFLDPRHVDALLDLMAQQPDLRMATLATPFVEAAQFLDANAVKVVVSGKGRALYFSRAPIPFDRDGASRTTPLRHLGVYAYEAKWLLEMAALPPSPLEETECLEQLRALEAGVAIGVAIVENVVPIAIDTPDDLERARAFLRGDNG